MMAILVMAAIAYRLGMLDAALVGAAIAGCCIGFLWFNAYPADIFMGDTGSARARHGARLYRYRYED